MAIVLAIVPYLGEAVSQEWYYSVDGGREGPVSSSELKKLAEAGKLKSTDLVWKDGMAEWAEAKSIKGLFPASGNSSAGTPKEDSKSRAPVEKDEDRPKRRRDEDDDEEEDDRPRKRRRDEDDDDEEDDRPRKRRRDEDDDDRPRKKKSRSSLPDDVSNRKMVAGILALLLGGWGVHKFYLGMTGAGVLQIVITFITCGLGAIVPLIEGIIYLTKTDRDFYEIYMVDQKNWF